MHYKELGFVNTKNMFKAAMEHKFAVPAYNFNNMEQIQAIITACVESQSPVILQVSKGAREYANATLLQFIGKGAIEMMKSIAAEKNLGEIPVALHLDHGDSFELAKSCVDNGFSSVMIDASSLSYEENIILTKKVVDYAHQFDVTVEGELGVLAGIEEEVQSEVSHYTKPEEVIDFVQRTGVDSLAISIGTSHGANKFKPEQCTKNEEGVLIPPPLRFDILEEIEKKLPGFVIVLHGSSSVMPKYVNMINENGGHLPDTVGIPKEQLRKASQSSVCKINVDSDGRLVITAIIRKVLSENKAVFDPRKYLGAARDELIEVLKKKNEEVMGSNGKAGIIEP